MVTNNLAMSNNMSALPAGWSEAYDPNSGKTYYRDDVNQKTQWTRPTAPAKSLAINTNSFVNNSNPQSSLSPKPFLTAAPLDFSVNALPVGWEECIDPKTGRIFYRNHFTKSTTWTRPTAQPDQGVTKQTTLYGNGTITMPTFTNQQSGSVQGYYTQQPMQQSNLGYGNTYNNGYNPYKP
jgi:hypothetical protein